MNICTYSLQARDLIRNFLKNECLLIISALLALISFFFVSDDVDYLEHIDIKTLVLLFCLMACVAGLEKTGLFSYLLSKITAADSKKLPLIFVLTCFFTSMIITNDVALITFVPLTLVLLKDADAKTAALTVVMETIAANMGSMATPFGNPQNIFLYTHYNMNLTEFFVSVLPYAAISLLLIAVSMHFLKMDFKVKPPEASFDRKNTLKFIVLFAVSIAAVLGAVQYLLSFIIVMIVLLTSDRLVLRKIDYSLLATFLFFFIFSANICSLESISSFISSMISERGIAVSVITSQMISNVLAAITLAPFTSDGASLLIGTNIGGLGTPIASMASLISYRIYSGVRKNETVFYIKAFLAINFLFLAILCTAALFLTAVLK